MILRALYDLAHREGLIADPDFPLKPVTWLVTVTARGEIAGRVDTRTELDMGSKKPKLVAKSFPVPYQTGRSGTKAPPTFFVDNAKYVFGRSTLDKPFSPEEAAVKSGWFRRQIADCVVATGDEGARAVLTALEAIAEGTSAFELPAGCQSNDLFAFIYEPDRDCLVHMRSAVQAYWRTLRHPAPTSSSGSTDASDTFECMVTGASIKAPGLFPKVKNVPGGQSSGVPLVSFNAAAFTSYGLDSNENAPISAEAADACAIALQRLLDPAFPDPRPGHAGEFMLRRNYRLSDDTVACYWSDAVAEDSLDMFANLFEPDPAVVGSMYAAPWRGRVNDVLAQASFYALVLSGAQGRMAIRDWFSTSVAEAARHLAEHFADLRIVRNTPKPRDRVLSEQLPLRVLLSSLAPFGRQDSIPSALATNVFDSALRGTPYPLSLLQRAIERTRAEIGRNEWSDLERRDARAALIKAVLNRRRRQQSQTTYPELSVALDLENTNPGYLCGRLMAVIERLQQVALEDVNATVVDRFFGAASATPRAVFTRLLKNSRHHARKARDEPSKVGIVRWLEGQLDAISAHFDVQRNGFPAFLDLEQQGLFVLGYHQQRHDLWRKREPAAATTAPDTADTSAATPSPVA